MADPAQDARQMRLVAIVIATTMLIWLAIQAIGSTMTGRRGGPFWPTLPPSALLSGR